MKPYNNRLPSLMVQKKIRAIERKNKSAENKKFGEIYYMKIQTIFAAIGLFLSAILSTSSIWIGMELSQKSDEQRAFELKIAQENRKSDIVDKNKALCLDLIIKINNLNNDEIKFQHINIKDKINETCKIAYPSDKNNDADIQQIIEIFFKVLLLGQGK